MKEFSRLKRREFIFAHATIPQISRELSFVDTHMEKWKSRKKTSYLERFVEMIMRQAYWS